MESFEMPKPKAIVSVINDLVTDRRVHKTCVLLSEQGYEVLLVGRVLKNSLKMNERIYQTRRMKLWFEKGVAFYMEYTVRLFFLLGRNKAELLVANDLDTLLPNYYFSKRRKIPLVYDSHEIFCEVPELQGNPLKKKIWELLEKNMVPKLSYCITVNQSIANWFHDKYNVDFKVVRNIPDLISIPYFKTRKELNLPVDKKIILLQGAGINIQRGAEEAVEAMQYLSNAVLLIIGGGDAIPNLVEIIKQFNLQDKVRILGKMRPEELTQYTRLADIGLSMDKASNINYQYSLPNKLFDYVHAGVPVLASPLTEIKGFIERYQVGICIDTHEPEHIATKIREMLDSKEYPNWKANTFAADAANSWDEEKKVWISLIHQIKRAHPVS